MKRAAFIGILTALSAVAFLLGQGGATPVQAAVIVDKHVHDDYFHPTQGFVVGPGHATAQALCMQLQPDTSCTAVITVGDSVRWVSPAPLAANPHTVTECTSNAYNNCGPAVDPVNPIGDSGILAPPNPGPSGWPYQVQFNAPGIFYYRCEVHPTTMRGVVQVIAENGPPGPPPVGGLVGVVDGQPVRPASDSAGPSGSEWLAIGLALLGGLALVSTVSLVAVRARTRR
jgi:plastocyanin